MRMTFDAEDPHEIGKSGGDQVDRSRGAAKAITVSNNLYPIGAHWLSVIEPRDSSTQA
jgi:hypothetical protein